MANDMTGTVSVSEKEQTLSFTRQSVLPKEYAVLLNDIAGELRKPYTMCVAQLAEGREQEMDWWVSELASRNTFTNPLFTHCCFAVLVKRILMDSAEGVREVIVDSPALYSVLAVHCKHHHQDVSLKCMDGKFSRLKTLPGAPFYYLRYMLEYLAAKFVARRRNQTLPDKLTLVDTFIFDSSFKDGEYQDRYYDLFGGFLQEDEQPRVFYMPTLANNWKNTLRILREIRSARQHFLLKEDYLKISDYIFAFLYPLRQLKFLPKETYLEGLNITPLVRAAWFSHLTSASSVEGLLKFQFARRLKENNVSIRLMVDWFENQSIDKGANAGFRKHYPDTPIVGYEGYIIPEHYLGMYPTRKEYECGVLPQHIAVCGKGFEEDRKEFCDELNVVTAPAFRFTGVWKERKYYPDPDFHTVLVALHLTIENSIDVLRTAVACVLQPLPPHTRFWIKPHPASDPFSELLQHAGVTLPPGFEIIQGDFNEKMEQSDVLMGNTSSTCLETLTKGIPVIVIGSRTGLTQNPIPDAIPQDMWRLCYTPEEAASAIQSYASIGAGKKKHYEEAGYKIRQEYFEPVTRETVRKFLKL